MKRFMKSFTFSSFSSSYFSSSFFSSSSSCFSHSLLSIILSTLISMILPVALLIFGFLSETQAAPLRCHEVFKNTAYFEELNKTLPKKIHEEEKSYLSKFAPKTREMALSRLLKSDERLALISLTTSSPTLEHLENFTSPALIGNEVINIFPSNSFIDHIKQLKLKKSIVVSAAIAENLKLSETEKFLIDAIEIRYRIAVEIIQSAQQIKAQLTHQESELNSVNPEEYTQGLIQLYKNIFSELSQNNKHEFLVQNLTRDSLNWKKIEEALELELKQNPFFEISRLNIINSSFVNTIELNKPLLQQIQTLGEYLNKQLEKLPVGISLRTWDSTSTVRFGNQHFYGNWFMHNSTDREAYLRGSKKMGFLSEVELRASPLKKKKMAVMLDQTFQKLDPILNRDKKSMRCFHTCGTFPPFFFIQNGIPVISPSYIVPGPAMLSLNLQHKMGFKNVVETRFSSEGAKELAIDIPMVIMHEGVGAGLEIGYYIASVTSAGVYFYHLLNDDEEEFKKRPQTESDWDRLQKNLHKVEQFIEALQKKAAEKKLSESQTEIQPEPESQPTYREAVPKDFY